MHLNKNEKKVLCLLIEDGKATDSSISQKLKISSQAVGKIRKKLESTVIESYSANVNFSKVGIKVFAISLSKITKDGLDTGELEIEKKIFENPNIIEANRLPNAKYTYIIFYGFEDMEDLDNFFHSNKNSKELFKFVENKEIFTFSHNSLIKNNYTKLLRQLIEDSPKNEIPEFEKFEEKMRRNK